MPPEKPFIENCSSSPSSYANFGERLNLEGIILFVEQDHYHIHLDTFQVC